MIDFRLKTFLSVCRHLNYTRAAEEVHVTQPAVTQHIKFLEGEYGCTLFEYRGKQLFLTEKGRLLQQLANQLLQNERYALRKMQEKKESRPFIKIGATKTIGEYCLPSVISPWLEKGCCRIQIDNTQNLLSSINNGGIDIAFIEGFFDSSQYETKIFRSDVFTGLCASVHPFAGKTVTIQELLDQPVFLREEGSGSRAIFESFLEMQNITLESFSQVNVVNSVPLISSLVELGLGISFGYKAIAENKSSLSCFTVEGLNGTHDYTIAWLKQSVNSVIQEFLESFSVE